MVRPSPDQLNALRRGTDEFRDTARIIDESVFEARPTQRGELIEENLAQTEFSDVTRLDDLVDAQTGAPLGRFETFDFFDSRTNEIISLKTVDTRGTSWPAKLKSDLRTVANSIHGKIDGRTPVLDVRVQPGGQRAPEFSQLQNQADDLGVVLRITEFPDQ